MNNIKALLSEYFQILNGTKTANFLLCKKIPVAFSKTDSTETLWKKHDEILNNFKTIDTHVQNSFLDLKIELAKRIFKSCHFCERRCKIDRNKGIGACKVEKTKVTSEFLHLGEEHVLIPSHTIFFSGCTFRCVFCQNWDISQENNGLPIEPEKLAAIIHNKKQQGARNVNWVGGDPTPNLLYILEVIKKIDDSTPQVWNSNMYCSQESMKLLNGLVDLYLTDFKYGNNDCAKRLSKVDNYLEIIKRNHEIAYEKAEMIIRHLIMPNHIECCSKPIMKIISKNFPNACVNIMAQYRPEYHACDYEDISRHVSINEVLSVKDYANELGINQI